MVYLHVIECVIDTVHIREGEGVGGGRTSRALERRRVGGLNFLANLLILFTVEMAPRPLRPQDRMHCFPDFLDFMLEHCVHPDVRGA